MWGQTRGLASPSLCAPLPFGWPLPSRGPKGHLGRGRERREGGEGRGERGEGRVPAAPLAPEPAGRGTPPSRAVPGPGAAAPAAGGERGTCGRWSRAGGAGLSGEGPGRSRRGGCTHRAPPGPSRAAHRAGAPGRAARSSSPPGQGRAEPSRAGTPGTGSRRSDSLPGDGDREVRDGSSFIFPDFHSPTPRPALASFLRKT